MNFATSIAATPTPPAMGSSQQTLSSHVGICSGILLFSTPQATTGDNQWKMLDFSDVQLFDESGTKFTHKYDSLNLFYQVFITFIISFLKRTRLKDFL